MAVESKGYEKFAAEFQRKRNPAIGPITVRNWAKRLAPGASVLDLGCGYGVPISEVLLQDGFAVHGVDASPTLVAQFRERFPGVPVECNSIESSPFFHRTFDAAVAWGLMFLLSPEIQQLLIAKVARALNKNGRFLFTAPHQECTWTDVLSRQHSISLGREWYEKELNANGLVITGNDEDQGNNYYFFAAMV